MQCCGAVGLRRVHVGFSIQQGVNRVGIAIHDGIGDFARAGSAGSDQKKC
jgi:hypothetical protein